MVLRNIDRLIFVSLYRLIPSILGAIVVVKPETVVRWHRRGFRAYWHWKSRRVGGRPKIDREIRDLIRRMNRENPLWGAPRIHGELLMLGIEVAESTVAKYMTRPRRSPSLRPGLGFRQAQLRKAAIWSKLLSFEKKFCEHSVSI